MNIYFKNFGIWLGGLLLLTFLLPYVGIYFPLYWLAIIGGTIIGVVQTHKALNGRIEFGKAVLATLPIIFLFFIINVVIVIARWGAMDLGFFIEFWIVDLLSRFMMVIAVLLGTGVWYMFEKAGKPGYGFLIPIYNIILILEIAKKPVWWIAMFFIPIANIVFAIMMLNGISKNFGKSEGFTVGLVFLGQIFMAILGYGDAVFVDAEGGNKPDNPDLLDN